MDKFRGQLGVLGAFLAGVAVTAAAGFALAGTLLQPTPAEASTPPQAGTRCYLESNIVGEFTSPSGLTLVAVAGPGFTGPQQALGQPGPTPEPEIKPGPTPDPTPEPTPDPTPEPQNQQASFNPYSTGGASGAAGSGGEPVLSVAENSPAGTAIGNPVSATDPEGDRFTFALARLYDRYAADGSYLIERDSHGVSNEFDIDAQTGQIKVKAGANLDYESGVRSYRVAIRLYQGGVLYDPARRSKFLQQKFTINVTPVDEAPVFKEAGHLTRTVGENPSGVTSVGAPVAATDPEGHTIVYLLKGTDAGSFSLNGSTGQISTKAGATYDLDVKASFQVIVDATANGLVSSKAVTINLTDTNQPPAYSSGGTIQINEGSGTGGVIGTVVFTDPENDPLTYRLEGADAAAFTVNSSGQISTVRGHNYDYEGKQSYTFKMYATDDRGLSDWAAVSVILLNVNEPIVWLQSSDSRLTWKNANSVEISLDMSNAGGQDLFKLSPRDGDNVASSCSTSSGFPGNKFTVLHGTVYPGGKKAYDCTLVGILGHTFPDDSYSFNVYASNDGNSRHLNVKIINTAG